jgi:hypothetical protein
MMDAARVRCQADLECFDRLEPQLRSALREARHNWSCLEIERARTEAGLSVEEMCREIVAEDAARALACGDNRCGT